MPDVYDQDLEGLAAAEETQTQEAQAAVKTADKPQTQAETKTSAQAQSRTEASTDDSVKLNKEEYADFQRMRQAAQLSQMETDFRKSYPDFDMQKITDKILEIDEKNPGAGDALLTPVGLENVYLKFFHGKAQEQTEDEFDIARGTGGGVSVKELIGKINKGEASDSEKQAFYSRFF
ncbi:hypothetical protein [uncultured Campylobacter sp.]|uniref:hypothetical protein n=1 Tax=uncultured Campylobacter sp. TaxID=218934 RepID=UPI0028E1EE52|nr:hypothetical protein [uncultured Campylobacter sp.]